MQILHGRIYWHRPIHRGAADRSRAQAALSLHADAECNPKIVFSVSLEESVDSRPDCYHIYKEWCRDVEVELEDVLASRLSLDPAATSKVIKYARSYEAAIYKNPARVLSRVQSWMPLEAEYPGTDVRRLLALNPQLISYKTATIRAKLEAIADIFELQDRSKVAQRITRCSAFLTRSTQSLAKQVHSLRSVLGTEGATAAVSKYPELVSRDADVLKTNFAELAAVLDGDISTAQRMVGSNPSLLKYRDISSRLQQLAVSMDVSVQEVVRIVQAVPTILNLSPQTIQRRMRLATTGLHAWSLSPDDLMPSVLGRLVTSSDARIARLLYISFLHRREAVLASRAAAADSRSAAVARAAAAAAVARAAAAMASQQRLGQPQHGSAALARRGRSRTAARVRFAAAEAEGGCHSPVTEEGGGRSHLQRAASPPGKKPITILNMKESEFKEVYPRFERWHRRQNRTSGVQGQRL
eukprot:jgi/Ulvmu1/10760/UM068_0050.1